MGRVSRAWQVALLLLTGHTVPLSLQETWRDSKFRLENRLQKVLITLVVWT